MALLFDPEKDRLNLAKHGISLSRADDMETGHVVADDRFYERRFRIYGLIDGEIHCLAVAPSARGLRAISLRRAHKKEFDRHAS